LVVETSKQLFDASIKAVNLKAFKNDIKSAVKGLFDFGDNNFDPDLVLLP